jgi:cytochrome c
MRLVPSHILLLICLAAAGCDTGEHEQMAAASTDGNPDRAPQLIAYYGCASCHTIPGIRGADALVGPPLTHLAARPHLGGAATNTPENLTQWIRDPHSLNPRAAMPNIDVSDADAKDIAAYLLTLR